MAYISSYQVSSVGIFGYVRNLQHETVAVKSNKKHSIFQMQAGIYYQFENKVQFSMNL